MNTIPPRQRIRIALATATALALIAASSMPATAEDGSGGGQVIDEIRKGLSGISKYFWSSDGSIPGETQPAVPPTGQQAAPAAPPAASTEGMTANGAADTVGADTEKSAVSPAGSASGEAAAAAAVGAATAASETTASSAEAATAGTPVVQAPPPAASTAGSYVWMPDRGSELEAMFATGVPAQIMKANGELERTDGRWVYVPVVVGVTPDIGALRETILDAVELGAWVGEGAGSVYVFETGKTYAELVGSDAVPGAVVAVSTASKAAAGEAASRSRAPVVQAEQFMSGMNPLVDMKGGGQWTNIAGRWLYLPIGAEDMAGMGGMEGMAALVAAAPQGGGWMQRNGRWGYVAPAGSVVGMNGMTGMLAMPDANAAPAEAAGATADVAAPATGTLAQPVVAGSAPAAAPTEGPDYAWQPAAELGGGEWVFQHDPSGRPVSPDSKWITFDRGQAFVPGGDADLAGLGGMPGMAALSAEAPPAGGWVQKDDRWVYFAPLGPDRASTAVAMVGAEGAATAATEGGSEAAGASAMTGMNAMSGMEAMSGMSAMSGMGGTQGVSAASGDAASATQPQAPEPSVASASEPNATAGMTGVAGMDGMTGMAATPDMGGMAGMGGATAARWTQVEGRWVYLPDGERDMMGMGGMSGMAALTSEAPAAGGWLQRDGRWIYFAPVGPNGAQTAVAVVGADAASKQATPAQAGTAASKQAAPAQAGTAAADSGRWERRGDVWVHVGVEAQADAGAGQEVGSGGGADARAVPAEGAAGGDLPGIAVVGPHAGAVAADTSAPAPVDGGDLPQGLAEAVPGGAVAGGNDAAAAPMAGDTTRSASLLPSDSRSDAEQPLTSASRLILFFVPGPVPGTGTWYSGPADILASAKPVYNPAFAGGGQ